jgi:GNAT superfamily N-acetyltransferase
VIRPFDPERDDVEEITSLLHRAYRVLLDQGLRFTATAQGPETTLRRLTQGEGWLMEEEGRVVGTVSVLSWREAGQWSPLFYRQEGVCWFSQLAVEPGLQGSGRGRALVDHAAARAVALGGRVLALDTSDQAGDLIRWYQSMGFAVVDRHVWGGEINYESLILARELPHPSPGQQL